MSTADHDDELVTIAIVDRATMAQIPERTTAPEFKIPPPPENFVFSGGKK